MQPPHQHSRINLAEFKALIVRKLGPEKSKQYFNYLNRLLSLKLNKVDFNKICLGIVGRENIPLHNQFIRSILKNACTAKVPLPTTEAENPNATRDIRIKESLSELYQQTGSHPALNQFPNPQGLSNGDILPLSPRKARTGTHGRVGERVSALGTNRTSNVISQQLSSAWYGDFNVILENGESTPIDSGRSFQNHQGIKQQRENKVEVLGDHPAKVSAISAGDTVSVHSKNEAEFFVKDGGKDTSARRLLHPPLGIPFCSASVGGARRALPFVSSSEFISLVNSCGLLDNTTLREQMKLIASTHGLEGVSADCATMLNRGLDAYLLGLIRSCVELVGARSGHEPAKHSSHRLLTHLKLDNGIIPGHHNQMLSTSLPSEVMHEHKPSFPISLLDFKVAMELNPQQLGEDWPLLLEKICTNAFEKET